MVAVSEWTPFRQMALSWRLEVSAQLSLIPMVYWRGYKRIISHWHHRDWWLSWHPCIYCRLRNTITCLWIYHGSRWSCRRTTNFHVRSSRLLLDCCWCLLRCYLLSHHSSCWTLHWHCQWLLCLQLVALIHGWVSGDHWLLVWLHYNYIIYRIRSFINRSSFFSKLCKEGFSGFLIRLCMVYQYLYILIYYKS